MKDMESVKPEGGWRAVALLDPHRQVTPYFMARSRL
jgi:hypothetical protein